MRERVEAEVNVSPKTIYNEEIARLHEVFVHDDVQDIDIVAEIPRYDSLKNHFYKIRARGKLFVRKHLNILQDCKRDCSLNYIEIPNPPRSLDDIAFAGKYAQTINNRRFLLFDKTFQDGEKQERVVVFASDKGLEWLSKAIQWHVDGTFRAAPKNFHQLYTVHAWQMDEMSVCAFAFLTNKSQETYRRLLERMKTEATRLGFELRPEILFSDFELAALNAFMLCFPALTVRGCQFHFCQAIIRHVNTLGFKVRYSADSTFRQWVKSLAALSFIPADQEERAWTLVKANRPPASDLLVTYMERTWFEGKPNSDGHS